MKVRLSVLILILASASQVARPADAELDHARKLLASTILVDGHNDLPWAIRTDATALGDVSKYDLRAKVPGQTDIARLRAGGVGAQFWSVYVPGELTGGMARTQLEQIDIARQLIARYPDVFELSLTAADIRRAKKSGKIGSLLGIEGGHVIENSLGALRTYYDLGVRYMTLTHNSNTDWADSAADLPPKHSGLNALGEQVVLEMNRLGMLVDLSHTSVDTMADAIRVSKAPVIFSHSDAKGICDVPRNVPDGVLKMLPANGGVLMVTFVAGFVDPNVAKVTQPMVEEYNRRTKGIDDDAEREKIFKEILSRTPIPRTTVAAVADQIDYIRKVAGVRHVGIGGDFDGNTVWPEGLSDVSMYPNLFAELIRRGWSDADLKLLAGENILRAMGEAENVAARLQRELPAPAGLAKAN
jgi:membrane dipeptidase